MEAGVPTRVLDAIHGHAPKTAAEGYSGVTLKMMAQAMKRLRHQRGAGGRLDAQDQGADRPR
jgi:hypothetical protein